MDRLAVVPETGIVIPGLFAPDAPTGKRVFEFFTANIRNRHTREAYARGAAEFSAWCERRGIGHLRSVEPSTSRLTLRSCSSAWRRCGCCSTGSSSGRSCRQTPPASRPQFGQKVAKQLESVKHLLWHGNTEEALERLGGLVIELDLLRAFSPPADKLGKSLGEFETVHPEQHRIHSELRGTLPSGRNDHYSVCRIDD